MNQHTKRMVSKKCNSWLFCDVGEHVRCVTFALKLRRWLSEVDVGEINCECNTPLNLNLSGSQGKFYMSSRLFLWHFKDIRVHKSQVGRPTCAALILCTCLCQSAHVRSGHQDGNPLELNTIFAWSTGSFLGLS